MPLTNLTPVATITGSLGETVIDVATTVTSAALPDLSLGGILVTATIVPDKLLWSDYDTAPLTFTLTIINAEPLSALSGPIDVSIALDNTLVSYVADSVASSTSTAFENVLYDQGTGTLSITLPDDIEALVGTAIVSFQVAKPAA